VTRRRPLRERVAHLWRARDGKLTELLHRMPGGHGLAGVHDAASGAARATMPLLRNAAGVLEPVRWPAALDRFVRRFKEIQATHGPHAVAFLGTSQAPVEEQAFLGALARFGMGLLHGAFAERDPNQPADGHDAAAGPSGTTARVLAGLGLDRVQRSRIARALGIDPARIPTRAGWSFDQIMAGIARGTIRGLWVVAAGPSPTGADAERARDLIDKLEFVVVHDRAPTGEAGDAAQWADLVLPTAGRDEAGGLSDFRIFQLVADTWGCGDMFARWRTPADVAALLEELSGTAPAAAPGATVPVAAPAPSPPVVLAPRGGYPFTLVTSRRGGGRGGAAAQRELAPTGHVELHAEDAASLGVDSGDWVQVSSRRGAVELRAFVTRGVARGCVFIPRHLPATRVLAAPAVDARSGQPALAACAVAIERIEPPSLT